MKLIGDIVIFGKFFKNICLKLRWNVSQIEISQQNEYKGAIRTSKKMKEAATGVTVKRIFTDHWV
jgi:hypothetical protein